MHNESWFEKKYLLERFSVDEESLSSTIERISRVRDVSNWLRNDGNLFHVNLIVLVSLFLDGDKASRYFRLFSNIVESDFDKTSAFELRDNDLDNMKQMHKVVKFMQEKVGESSFDNQRGEIMALLEDYTASMTMFHAYDERREDISQPDGRLKYELQYDDCIEVINNLKERLIESSEASDLFGRDKAENLKQVIGAVNQSIDGHRVYNGIEETAAHLLYLIIKDHPFVDGNKRIGSILFLYFLEKNKFLWKVSAEKKINDNALVTLGLFIAGSSADEKNVIISLIVRLLQNDSLE